MPVIPMVQDVASTKCTTIKNNKCAGGTSYRSGKNYFACSHDTWRSGPLLCMARVLIPVRKLLMLMLTITLLVEYYTLK
jgi:hypothetical protein